MKKILLSFLSIGAVAIVAVYASQAFFSDEEKSTGNVFTAGSIDLKVDSQQHYNNAVCTDDVWVLEADATVTVPQYPVIGSACEGTWGQTPEGKDIVSEKFFNFNDVKPGDSGENTVSLHVVNNDAWVCAEVSNLTSSDVSQTEPESLAVLDTDDMTSGELDDTMVWTVWRDDGDNVLETDEPVLISGHPVNGVLPVYDSTTATPLSGNSTTYLGVKWELPAGTGNEAQTDSLMGDISFRVEQARNNANFRCIPPTPVHVTSNPLFYGPTGWGGWSCPANTTVVDSSLVVTGGDLALTLAWKPAATIGAYTYPTTPFGYTYGANETGFIGQNDNDSGESIVLNFDCMPN